MEIVRLYIRGEEKRGVVDRMVLEEGVGILGQVQGKEDRQVSVLPGEVRQALENMEEHGLCTQRFQENITIDQLDLGEWGPGDRMRMGEVLVEITRLEKSCFSDCPLLRSHSKCPLAKGVLYAKVVEGGTLQKGESVSKI